MKHLNTLLFLVFVFGGTAQNYTANADLVIMDKSGQPFYLIIDGIAQNAVPKFQIKIVGVPAAYHEVKLLYTNGITINLQQNVTLQPYKQHTALITWRKGMKRFEWIEIANINQSNFGRNVEIIMFTPAYNQVCNLCITPSSPGYHYHADGTVHNNYIGNNSHGGNYSPNGNYPPNGNTPYNPNCQTVLPTIDPVLDEIKNINFSSTKMEYAMDALRNKCINSDQAYKIVESFDFDSDRVKMAKFCYDRMTDQVYANKLLDLFKFTSSRNEVRKYFTR